MNIGKEILRLQNREENLKLLLVQRDLYSKAKLFYAIQFVFVGVPVLLALVSLVYPGLREFNAIFSIVLFVIDLRYLETTIRTKQGKAAQIQELFDCNVFGLPWPGWIIQRPSELFVAKQYLGARGTIESEKLRNWYAEPISAIKDYGAVLICQWQNVSYSLELRKGISVILEFLWVGLPIIFVIYCAFLKLDVETSILLFVPLIPIERWFIKEDMQHSGNVEKHQSLKSYIESLRSRRKMWSGNKERALVELRRVQDKILYQRLSGSLIFDWFYWFQRNKNETAFVEAATLIVKK